jgi:signal transduction histidine kinase
LAWRWRIRDKLLLGLALVVSILALLLAGTFKGLAAYRATMNSIDSKLVELIAAHKLRSLVRDLFDPLPLDVPNEAEELRRKVDLARAELNTYQERLRDTLAKDRDPDPFGERNLIDSIQDKFNQLDQHIAERQRQAEAGQMTGSRLLLDDRNIRPALVELSRAADQLPDEIYNVLYKHVFQSAKANYRLTMTLVISVSVLGVLLMICLLRSFYRWTFYPVRDLQAGVGRVAQGDFDHVIEVHSSDEMEELANGFNDMTRRLRDMYGDLARQVNERSRQLVRSERLAGVGFLAAGVAHEINNPLASIAFCSEALESRLTTLLDRPSSGNAMTLQLRPAADDDRGTVLKYLKMIQQEAFRCKEITQRLLEFSRGGERSREATDLAEIIQSVIDVSQHLPNFKGKTIDFAGGHAVAWVNAQEIKSVVLNLVVNALDSMDDGGKLSIHLTQQDGLAEMSFTDSGCGMTPEVLENIFEPFFTRSRTGKGTGLGLSISHRVVSQHGGEIEATSAGPGQGSTFTVRIPMQPVLNAQEETTSGRIAA